MNKISNDHWGAYKTIGTEEKLIQQRPKHLQEKDIIAYLGTF